jgi:hypothetical protein
MRFVIFIVGSLMLSSCGYHYAEQEDSGKVYTVTVPYISGDSDAILNNALVYQLGSSGRFRCVQSGGEYILQATFLSDNQSRIDFRYDRDNVTGSLEKNLLGVEDRRTVLIRASLVDAQSKKVIVGPFEVSSDVEYDYIDPGSPLDLLFTNASGSSESIIQFSLGQLDSSEGAFDDSSKLLFERLAEKVTEGLVNYLSDN